MASSDIIKIGFDYRSSLAQFEKDTNGVFDGISSKAGKQKIIIQLDAKDDKVIDKIKELQKLKLDKFTFEFGNSGLKEQLQTFDKLENKINEIINLSKGIGNSSTSIVDVNKSSKEIDKLESKISELNKKYDELQKKSASGSISGKEVNLVDNDEFKKLSQEVSELKDQFDDLKTHMILLDDYTVPTDRFFELQTQVEATSVKVSDLVDKMTRLSNIQKNLGAETNISSGLKDAIQVDNSSTTNASTSAIKEENNVLEQTSQSAEKAANSKKKFAKANQEVKASADASVGSIQDENNAFDQNEWDKNVKAIQDYMDAVTKLNKLKASDAGKDKKLNEIAVQEQEVERLKQIAYDARTAIDSVVNPHTADNQTWTEWVSAMKQFAQASNGSAESVAKLEDALRNAKVQAEKTQQAMLNSYSKRLDGYSKKGDSYQATANKFKDGGWTSDAYTQQIDKLNNAIQEYKTLLASMQNDSGLVTDENINKLNEYEADIKKIISTVSNMSAAEKGFTKLDGQKTMNWISQQLRDNSAMSREAKNQIKAYYAQIKSGNPTMSLAKIRAEVLEIVNAEEQAGRAGKSMFAAIKEKVFYGIAGAITTYFGFNDFLRYGREAIDTIVELDDALVDLKKTTTMSGSRLENFYYDANDVAKQMGVTTAEIINQSSAWSRLGFSSAEASTQMSKLSAQFAAISPGMDIDTATDGLVSTMKAFDIDVSNVQREVMDNINKIGNTAATSNDEIVDMLTRSSAAMSAANNTLEETIALETAAVEITRSAETTGTAFKTLSMRLRGYDEETESYTGDVEELSGDIADLTKTASTPGGISLFTDDTKQTYKSTYELLKEISDIYSDLSDKNRAELLEKLAGKRGGQVVAGLLSNFSAAEKAMQDMDDAAGSSDAEMSIIEQSLTYKINALKETWVGAVQQMVDRGDLGTIVTGLTKLSEGITFVTSNLGLLKTAALGISTALSIKNIGEWNYISKFRSNNIICLIV